MTQIVKKNPVGVKLGDKLYVTRSNNGTTKINEEIVIVVREQQPGQNNIQVRLLTNRKGPAYNLYYSGPADDFQALSRNQEVKFLQDEIEIDLVGIEKNKNRIAFLKKYKTKEDFVATQIEEMLDKNAKLVEEPSLVRVKNIKKILELINDASVY